MAWSKKLNTVWVYMAALFNIYDTLDVLEYICTYVYSKHLLREK